MKVNSLHLVHLFRKYLISFILLIIFFPEAQSQNVTIPLTRDGTWCWFSGPRAIVVNDSGKELITGYVTSDGTVETLCLNLNTGEETRSVLYKTLETDDHNNPAFLQRADGHFLAFYTRHHHKNLYMNVSIRPGDAKEWGEAVCINPNGKATLEKYGDDKYTYANPIQLKKENNRIYLFGRWAGFKPNMSWSDDGGKSWEPGRVVICPQPFSWGERPYVNYYSDGEDKIHMVFTDGHPRNEPFNSVYYACYHNGAFYRSDGQLICTLNELPFEPREASLVYDATKTGHRAWVFDLVANSEGFPSIAYARYPTETDHIYHYAWFDGNCWNDRKVVHSGKWFPQTPEGSIEREPHYSGGMALDPDNAGAIYLSREVEEVFEIERWTFSEEKEQAWTVKPITNKSEQDQIRPVVARDYGNSKRTVVLWNSVERYIHYTDFKTGIMMWKE